LLPAQATRYRLIAEMATPAAVYGAIAPVLALTFVFVVRRLDPAFRGVSASGTPVTESPA